jgi:NitT/TauT family transport system ATP-binding protein
VAEAVFLSQRVVILSSNPGRIAEEIAVPFPYPRTAALRESLEYQQVVSRATTALHAVLSSSTTGVHG